VQPVDGLALPAPELVAADFLNQNAALFGIIDSDDLVLVTADIRSDGGSLVSYRREVGGVRLSDYYIMFHIDPEGRIERIWGRIPAAPEDLYESVQRPILTEEEAREVATTELLSTGRHIWLTTRLTLILESAPPYLIWEASNDSPGNGGIINSRVKINAATGEVLDRHEVERCEFCD
jgi:Zn-dependent metalloprotease